MDKTLINALNGALEKKMSNITMLEGMAVETFKTKVLEMCSNRKDSDIKETSSTKVQLYRKKPVVIRAVQFMGDNFEDVFDFTKGIAYDNNGDTCMIPTLEGKHIATKGDYIIEGVHGEFYPCKPDIFHKTYEYEEKGE